MRQQVKIAIVSFASALSLTGSAQGFTYVFAGEGTNPNVVTHPRGYTGNVANQNFTIRVGIDPTSTNASAMTIPTQNVISTWNGLVPTTNNLQFGAANNIPSNQIDFESTLLHEMGHALGLSHPNLGDVTVSPNTDFTMSTDGANNALEFNDGADNVQGSRDDLRGDDVNLNWFRRSNNNPFTIAPVVDSTTYSRELTDLPAGNTYSANASRDVAVLEGVPNTEASLQQGAFFDEAQRTLGHDDVAGIRYARSGIDEIAGTADDYTFTLAYAGMTTDAEIVIDFDNTRTGFAVTQLQGQYLNFPDHIVVTSSPIYFNDTNPFFFNQVPVPEPSAVALLGLGGLALLRRRGRRVA